MTLRNLAGKLKAARKSFATSQRAFEELDQVVSKQQRDEWLLQEWLAQEEQKHNPVVMDIFQVINNAGMFLGMGFGYMLKQTALSICNIEIELLCKTANAAGSANSQCTWLAWGLQIKESAIILAWET